MTPSTLPSPRVPFTVKHILFTTAATVFVTLFVLHAFSNQLVPGSVHSAAPLSPPGPATDPHYTFLSSYNPIKNSALFKERLTHECNVLLPSNETLATENTDWSLTRYVMNHNLLHLIHTFLEAETGPGDKLSLLDFGQTDVLLKFPDLFNITRVSYPQVDIHDVPFETGTFDVVSSDQVFEHIAFPHLAFAEMHRVLKVGGVAIVTSCAYNPVHEAGGFHDYWRFMVDGMRMLSMGFEGGILGCGGWGTKKGIVVRVEGKSEGGFWDMKKEEAIKNDARDPWVTWLVVRK